MTEKILSDIKKLLGIDEDCDAFDQDILIHINSVIMALRQIGVGSEDGVIVDADTTWTDYIGSDDAVLLANVRTYIYLKVRVIFDPPSSTSIIDAFNENAKEMEWRISVQVDPGKSET